WNQRSAARRDSFKRNRPYTWTIWPGRDGSHQVHGFRPHAANEEALVVQIRRNIQSPSRSAGGPPICSHCNTTRLPPHCVGPIADAPTVAAAVPAYPDLNTFSHSPTRTATT